MERLWESCDIQTLWVFPFELFFPFRVSFSCFLFYKKIGALSNADFFFIPQLFAAFDNTSNIASHLYLVHAAGR
jgi:hypothetical protein